MFVTLVIGFLDLASGMLTYANAGHPAPYLTQPGCAPIALAEQRPAGIALGVLEGVAWQDRHVDLKPGQGFVLVTDGIADMLAPGGGDYTAAQVVADLGAVSGVEPDAVTSHLVQQCFAFGAGAIQEDDVTVLALRLDP